MLPVPYGLALIITQPNIPVPDRREYVDANNQIQTARLIDASSKDYVQSSNGHFVGQEVIKQQVYISLLTFFNSSSQRNLGNQIFNIKIVTPNIVNQCKSYVELALANLINNKSITLNTVNVILNGPGVVIVNVIWTDNDTASSQTTNIPVGQV